MSLVTRVSVAFLVALALALGGFSACLYYVAGLRLRLALDQELEATLDHFPDRPEVESGRVTWAIYDEAGRRIESTSGTGRPMILDGRDLGPLAVDVATTIGGSDGLRWRVLARPIGGGRRRGGPPEARGGEHRPRPPARDEHKGAAPGRERPASCAGRVGFARARGGRDPIAGDHPALALAGPLGPGRGDRPSFRPARSRPADSDGRVGPRHALRRLPAAQSGDARRTGRIRQQFQRAPRPPACGARAAEAVHRPGFAPAPHSAGRPDRRDRRRPPPPSHCPGA